MISGFNSNKQHKNFFLIQTYNTIYSKQFPRSNMEVKEAKQRQQIMESGDSFFKKTTEQSLKRTRKEKNCMQVLRKVLISIPYQIVITTLTIYSLIGDDIRIAVLYKDTDIIFDGLNIALVVIFLVEIFLSSIALDNYFLSFFFVLDIVSTLSLLLDISLFTDVIYASNATNSYSFSQVAAQSKASRAAIRAVRIVKLFRIIRIVKLYKSALKAEQIHQRRKKQLMIKQKVRLKFERNFKPSEEESSTGKMKVDGCQLTLNPSIKFPANGNKMFPELILEINASPKTTLASPKLNPSHLQEDQVRPTRLHKKATLEQVENLYDAQILQQVDKKQSKIRKVMGDIILRKVIIVVLMLMFFIPLFDSDIYTDQANSFDFALNNLNNMLIRPQQISIADIIVIINDVLQDHKDEQSNLIYFSTPFNQLPLYKHDDFFNTRISDFVVSNLQIKVSEIINLRPDLTIRSDITDEAQRKSMLCMLDQYSYSTNQSLLSLGRTLFICALLIGLLHFFNNDIEELIVRPIQKMMEKLKAMAQGPQAACREQIDPNALYQTTIVSNAIVKIGALLSIVFGSAGAQIIGKNIVQQGDMNPMIQGKKKCAIFGFCDIRKFNQINQILEEDILLFVNKISSIVHKAVYRYGGSANKNIGQAFLLVWKLPEGDYSINKQNNEITWHNREYLSVLADFSVYSFIKTLIKINKSAQVLDYRKDYRLLQKMPNYKVEMGFGLHVGWAIEGAIGSEYKIDASYLSPNVNMASRLEAATKQFGVNFLISEDLYDILTPGLQNYCRMIDRVTVKGSKKPLNFYTVDMNLDNISPSADKTFKYPNIPDYQPDMQLKRDINMQFLQPDQIKNYSAQNFIISKKQFREVLINAVSGDFKKRFEEGVKSYLEGKWSNAKLHFSQAQKIRSNDGPTKRLLSYMKNYDFVAPLTWNNFRQLTSK